MTGNHTELVCKTSLREFPLLALSRRSRTLDWKCSYIHSQLELDHQDYKRSAERQIRLPSPIQKHSVRARSMRISTK